MSYPSNHPINAVSLLQRDTPFGNILFLAAASEASVFYLKRVRALKSAKVSLNDDIRTRTGVYHKIMETIYSPAQVYQYQLPPVTCKWCIYVPQKTPRTSVAKSKR
ncbi:uncharacterized protein TRIVIDRAFT_61056 [Trichoderma virens Gv29-8]|uniref:Uncharacterized protein n=1 Tax=Hypocrea virens (strain Gv29-8 / FGSC 10586) TaxID=413071 RepID=G9MLM8_HYPVG|nr:uncharacterized protein TRIVIDRAFT_61056 [Trichoderma virens Gv29-8]EHK24255.1 hypothetical protein TRIVIDRAFT_61056 [Trichoderma virens Gv29-8]UKZ54521.1 hypothetical protein TrVGV298_008329 [Trichoderma virens]